MNSFLSFQLTYFNEFLILWMIQGCTTVSGKTELIASLNPFKPSTQAIRMSLTPRCCRSVMTDSQKLAPSPSSPIQRPRTSFFPSRSSATHTYTGQANTRPSRLSLIWIQSRYMIGYTSSKGLFLQSSTSGNTLLVIWLIRLSDISTPYRSDRVDWISETVMPLAYMVTTLSSISLLDVA